MIEKGSSTHIRGTLPASLNLKSSPVSCEDTSFPTSDEPVSAPTSSSGSSSVVSVLSTPTTIVDSRSGSDGSITSDETMSTFDSVKTPEFEYIDDHDACAVCFEETKTGTSLHL